MPEVALQVLAVASEGSGRIDEGALPLAKLFEGGCTIAEKEGIIWVVPQRLTEVVNSAGEVLLPKGIVTFLLCETKRGLRVAGNVGRMGNEVAMRGGGGQGGHYSTVGGRRCALCWSASSADMACWTNAPILAPRGWTRPRARSSFARPKLKT